MSYHQSFKNIENLKEFCLPLDGYILLVFFSDSNNLECSIYDINVLDEYTDKLQSSYQNKLSFATIRHVDEDLSMHYTDRYLDYRIDLNTGLTAGYEFTDFRHDPIILKLQFLQLVRKLENEGS